MGTKANPAKWDCYKHAEPDEPMFVLLGRDPAASLTVLFWVKMRLAFGESADAAKLQEAEEVAKELEKWAIKKGKQDKVRMALAVMKSLLREL